MFNHATQVFSRRPSLKKPSTRKAAHLRDISTESVDSSSSCSSAASSASTLPLSASSTSFSSPTNAHYGLSASPTSTKPLNDSPVLEINPLSQHPTFALAPPPLSERPLIQPSRDAPPPLTRSVPPTVVAPKPIVSHVEWRAHLADMLENNVPQFPSDYSPRHTIHTSTPVSNSASSSAQDYFVLKVPPTRPELKSHWSVSTIQTPDVGDRGTPMSIDLEDEDDEGDVYVEDSRDSTPGLTPSLTPSPPISSIIESYNERDSVITVTEATEQERRFPPPQKAATAPVRNFSYKRSTVGALLSSSSTSYGAHLKPSSGSPRRPQMKTMDSIECWIKRGGWKRRGIVFDQNEGAAALATQD